MPAMKARDLMQLGYPPGPVIGVALRVMPAAAAALDADALRREFAAVLSDPVANAAHPQLAEVAQALRDAAERPAYVERPDPAPYRVWGEGLEPTAVGQMAAAARLPVAVAGALMPDAHLGYGLPIGGVLATDNAVIPYAVGVDIACRMRLTIFDIPAEHLPRRDEQLTRALQQQTLFGVGATFRKTNEHEVLDADWTVSPVTRKNRDKARDQLGSSGSGNHFAEFGILTLDQPDLGIDAGRYLALLTHSGSRGTGAAVADFYSKLAMEQHPDLPDDLRRLAWLGLDTEAGQEYWAAMELMGRYAAANHAIIHRRVTDAIGADAIATIENHHNFAWKEHHNGRDVIVHRKGATPAGRGVLGVIPGSMATPGYVVRGRGGADSLDSASHGAGRTMSRTAARNQYRWAHVRPMLDAAGVKLLSAGIDEAPVAYKDIHTVMAAQRDLVEVIARFDPKIVKMADAGEKPED
jgi:tRNA-splicing ligase RtcB